MRQIQLSNSLLTYLDELEYTEAALRADSATADLAGPFQQAIEDWPAIFQRSRAARRDVVRAEAVVAVRDAQLDSPTRKFGGVLLVEANQDRKSSLFRRFFPMAPSEFVRQGLRTQCERTRDVMLPELEKLDTSSPLRRFMKPLGDACKNALAALTTRSKAKGEAAMVAADVDEWKEGVNKLRRSTYAALMKTASDDDLPRDWPEMFFRAATSGKGEPTDEAGDAETDAPAPT